MSRGQEKRGMAVSLTDRSRGSVVDGQGTTAADWKDEISMYAGGRHKGWWPD